MPGRSGIITAGTWCVDTNKVVDFWPAEDGIAEYGAETREGGGSACNLALDVRALDADMPLETIGVVGDDENGRWLRELADNARIGTRQMHVVPGERTHISDAFVSSATRRRTHIHRPGVAELLNPQHFDFSATTGKLLHLGMPGCHRTMDESRGADGNGWVTVLRAARAAGIKTNLEVASVNPQTLRRVVLPCLPHLDMLIVNDAEIGAVSGLPTISDGVPDLAMCARAAATIIERGSMELIVIHSPAGAVALPRGGSPHFAAAVAVPSAAIAGANGAGDAFAAGVLYGIHENWLLPDFVKLGHAAAAASLRRVSTTGSVENWRACLQLASDWGWRSLPAA
jgi:sugar/nucleoside kinase (ribokinase family)